MHNSKPARSARSSLALYLLLTASMLTACSTSTPRSVATPIQPPPADLAAPCPDLPALADGSAKTVALWIVDAAAQYRDCSARQAGLARAWPGQSFGGALK